MKRNAGGRVFAAVVLTLLCAISAAQAQDAKSDIENHALAHTLSATNAGNAWLELQEANRLPQLPAQWRENPPSTADRNKFYLPFIVAGSDKARDFYTKYSNDVNVLMAKQMEYDFLALAVQIGRDDLEGRLDNLEKNVLSDTNLTQEQRFTIRQHSVERAAGRQESKGSAAVMAAFENGARELRKDFPDRAEVLEMLLFVASHSDAEKARSIIKEVLAADAPAKVKESAEALAKKLEDVGKPIQLQFTAVDGRAVDIASMKGKVVLVDFWATWCGPCLGELPHVKDTYDHLHAKGFEIVGISLDDDLSKLKQFAKEHQMDWPQFCDGNGWQSKYAQQFGVSSIPAMWLVDKKGVLRDMNAREDLQGKVEKLLAE